MADITKCHGAKCKIKAQCYRFTATDTPSWQSYGDMRHMMNGKCVSYIPNGLAPDCPSSRSKAKRRPGVRPNKITLNSAF